MTAHEPDNPDSDHACDFDWSAHAEHIVIPGQAAIATYCNPAGNIVVRQEAADPYYADDVYIVIAPHHVPSLIRALQAMIGEREVEAPPTAPMSNAERQKRYRQQRRNEKRNARNGKRNAPVTQDAELFTAKE